MVDLLWIILFPSRLCDALIMDMLKNPCPSAPPCLPDGRYGHHLVSPARSAPPASAIVAMLLIAFVRAAWSSSISWNCAVRRGSGGFPARGLA